MENIVNNFFHGVVGTEDISDLELLELIFEDKKIMNADDIRKYHSTYHGMFGFDEYLLRKSGVRYAEPDEVCLCFHPRNYELSCKQRILSDEPGTTTPLSYSTFTQCMNPLFYSNHHLRNNIVYGNAEDGYYAFIDEFHDCISLILSEDIINNQEYKLPNNFSRAMVYEIRVKGSIDLDKYLVGIGYSNPLDYLFLLKEYPFLEKYFKSKIEKNSIDNLLNHYSDRVQKLYALLEKHQCNNIPIVNPYSGIELRYPDQDYKQKIKEKAKKF